MTDDISDGVGTYDVVLLVEQELSASDAAQVRSLHEDIADHVVYHVLLPLEDAAARIGAGDGVTRRGRGAGVARDDDGDVDLEAVRRDCEERSAAELADTLEHLRAAGADARGMVTGEPPVDALAVLVDDVDAREAIVLTRPHVVAEFFHQDWASKARRKLGVPVLHLLERETFDEQTGQGEGVTGF